MMHHFIAWRGPPAIMRRYEKATISYKSTVLFDGNNLSAWKQEFLHVMNEFELSAILLRPASEQDRSVMTAPESV